MTAFHGTPGIKRFFKSKNARALEEKNLGPAITRGCDIRALQSHYPKHTTDEMCSDCEAEVTIPAYFESNCPECGARILPCSMCDPRDRPCDECPFDKIRLACKEEFAH